MMKFTKCFWAMFWAMAICAALVVQTMNVTFARGFDLSFGGPGKGKGTFGTIRDGGLIRHICFDTKDNLYVLDGLDFNGHTNELTGNALLQIFDNDGKFLREFSVMDSTLGDRNMPMRVAVDKSGNVFISQYRSGEVLKYAADGKLAKRIEIPNAFALTNCLQAGKDVIAVAARLGRIHDGVPEGGAEEIVLINAASGEIASRVKLSVPVIACQDIDVDSKGNFYLQAADTAELYKFDPTGKLLMGMGAGRRTQEQDGSVLNHAVVVDSKDNVYSITPGNPGNIVMFDSEFKTVKMRGGEFDWFDAWVFAQDSAMALDSKDRIWVVSNGNYAPGQRHHRRPAVVRATADFFDNEVVSPTSAIGLKTFVYSNLLYDISYEPGKPMTFEFSVAPARRRVNNVQVSYKIFDSYKNELDGKQFSLSLEDGKAASREISFTPPKFGWYTIICTVTVENKPMQFVAKNIGVTPRFDNMIVLKEGEAVGGWHDPARQSFVGLRLMRLGTGNNKNAHDEFDARLTLAEKYPDIKIFGIFTDVQDVKPENVRAVMERFKGRIKYWEVINEPNLGHVGPVEKYMEYLKETVKIIKEIDPNAKVLGPNTCGMDLNWNRKFLEQGGDKLIDIFTIHDYEGHEGLTPEHWRWKFGEFKKMLSEFATKDMPVWNTERGWMAERAGSFAPMVQAVRTMLHRDMLEIFGIPSENSHFYYLNNGGFGGYPAYLWSQSGPHIGPLATRMREAQIKDKRYAGELDFGPTGKKIFMGIHFTGEKEDIYIVRNLGFTPQKASFRLGGGNTATVLDWAGNVLNDKPSNGGLTLDVSQMPTYIRVAKGTTLSPVVVDFGKNIAGEAKFTFNGKDDVNNLESLNNGIFEVIHAGSPYGNTGGSNFLKEKVTEFPQMVEFTFPTERNVSKMLVFSFRPDNDFSALLDFDVQYFDEAAKKWVTAKEVRNPIPMSEFGTTPYSKVYSWVDDSNAAVVQLDKPVKASQFRLAILKTTAGLLANDPVALHSSDMPTSVHLREIEVYE